MPLTQTALHTFLVQSRAKDRPRLLLSLAAPPKHPSPTGRLFVLLEYPPESNFKIQLPLLINQIMRHYEEEVKEGPENAFERNLEWTNRLISQNWEPELWPKFNFILGCLKNNYLQFAAAGQMGGYIIFSASDGSASGGLDLIKTYGLKQEEGIFFTTLISGDLNPNNFVVFCTASVFDFLTLDRLKKILLSRPTEEACRYLEKTLSQIENNLSFGGIIITLSPPVHRLVKIKPGVRLTSDSSIRRLIRKEQETEKILSPSVWSALKDLLGRFRKKSSSETEKPNLETVKRIARIYNRLTGWQGQLKCFYKILKRPGRPDWLGDKFLALPLPRRFLLVGVILVISIFMVSLGAATYQSHRRAEQEKYNQLLNNIKEKLDQAESSIIYKNEEQARLILEIIKKDLADFPQNSKNRRLMRQRLTESAVALALKLRHLETVTPNLIADLTLLNLPCQPTDLIKIKTDYFTFCAGDKTLYQYNERTKNLTPMSSPFLGELKDKILKKDGSIILLNGRGRLTQFDPKTSSFTTQEIIWHKAETDIKLIGYYNEYLYALDAKNNLIYKNSPSTTGFAKGNFWLKENLKIDDTASWTIDGSIYLAKNNGEIWKLETGRRQIFDLSKLDPPLSAATQIFSSPDSKNLFILDPGQKRVVIWNKKDNQLAGQFTSSEFSDLRDLAVDEKEKKIYVLNGQKVLSFKY